MRPTLEELQALYNPEKVSLYQLLLSHHEIQKRRIWSQTKYQRMKEEKLKAPPPPPAPLPIQQEVSEKKPRKRPVVLDQ